MAPVWGVMASAINAFAGVGRPLAENQVRLVGLVNFMFPRAGPLVTFGAQAFYMLLYGRA
ncbi:hypothetical protein CI102_4580 [Trichoderma harzianum]|uniref:Uncharacterized protein n=1 Tax=Trichoderma harzianum CBS 226.95 TaxID=983964 RepID=A0A2T3ZU70_TRIHA|nr:hypothetical protein M431DRAFT_21392 [Trichoderma harzianum CBS 226.95]PKK52329.1 hypothetical protein CI102_4580 [Trichoderma harzianum]PTB48346.1 hypothetical protein M431DRAFT_21392 [Trichoderma harzianum CBS 226.95]